MTPTILPEDTSKQLTPEICDIPILPGHSYLLSGSFEIVAQSGQRRFIVDGDILAKYSEPLRCSISGGWKEAIDRKIDLSDWDGDTVEQFVEFLRFGDYLVPKKVEEDEEAKVGEGSERGGDERGLEGRKGGERNVLLVHMKLYQLAQYKDVPALKTMVLERIKTALEEAEKCIQEGNSREMVNVIKFLGYVYSHTDSLTHSKEQMRELAAIFVARSVETLIKRRELKLLLIDGGDLVVDLVEKIVLRCCGALECMEEVTGTSRVSGIKLSIEQGILKERRSKLYDAIFEERKKARERIGQAEAQVRFWKNRACKANDIKERLEIAIAKERNLNSEPKGMMMMVKVWVSASIFLALFCIIIRIGLRTGPGLVLEHTLTV